jgi:hypothetical protein
MQARMTRRFAAKAGFKFENRITIDLDFRSLAAANAVSWQFGQRG